MKQHPKQVIQGVCPSKSNSYQVIPKGLVKTDKLTNYERSFYLQNTLRNLQIDGLFEIEIHVFWKSIRNDLDNSLKIVMDCLQQCGTIRNDNRCVKITAEKFVDQMPRIEFTLVEV